MDINDLMFYYPYEDGFLNDGLVSINIAYI